MLENAKALASSYKELAEEYKEREARTEARIQAKESALLDSNKMCSSLRHDLDDAHTECAVANILRCEVTECVKRRPPLGATADTVVENAKEATRRVYDGQEQ